MEIREEVLSEAELIKHEGGEIPEIAFWNSYYWLTDQPPKGMGLKLNEKEMMILKEAVIERYLTIIKRDLTYENFGKPFFRGIERATINLNRLKKYLKKENLKIKYPEIKKQIKEWFDTLLKILKSKNEEFLLSNEQKEKFIKELEGSL